MKFLSSQEIRAFEEKVITDLASSLRLIDNAANACAKELLHFGAICVFCGKGNNGADGYRIASILAGEGKRVLAVRVLEPASRECRVMEERLIEDGVPCVALSEAEPGALSRFDAAVDAIFGIGMRGEVTGPAREAIELINSLKIPVVSVDVPSGLGSDSGKPCGTSVFADKTVTFTAPKLGMAANESVNLCGEIVIREAGIPVDWERAAGPGVLTAETASELLPERPRLSHKGSFGRALMVVGSPGMLGAAAIAARAAVRGGAGLVEIVCRRGLENTLNIMIPEAVVLPVDDAAAPELESALRSANALLIGCGLGKSVSAEYVLGLLDRSAAPAVLDADALNLLAGRAELLAGRNLVITPHPLEFSRLTGLAVDEIERDRLAVASNFARRLKIALVLKGARTVVAAPNGETWVSLNSTSALAKAGSGDTLAGLICALAAQGLPPVDAARLGVWLHGRAGIFAAKRSGEFSATVGEIGDCLKYAFMEVTGNAGLGGN